MKLKYYLRGLGIGIIVTTIILMISFSGRKEEMSDEEVMARAAELGMVTSEDGATEQQEDAADGEQDGGALSAEELLAQTQNASDETEDDVPENEEDEADVQEPEDADDADEADDAAGTDDADDTAAENTVADASGEEGTFRLTIQKGDVCRTVCEKLAEGGVITDAEALRKYLFEIGYASNMSVGEYDIPYGATDEEIAAILKEGPIE